MSTPDLIIETCYEPREGDLVLLPFANGTDPLFPYEEAVSLFGNVQAPRARGKSITVFAGFINEQRTMAKAIRLDKQHTRPEQALREAVSQAVSDGEDNGMGRVVVMLDGNMPDLVSAAQEGALLGGYRFNKYLSKGKDLPLVDIVLSKKPKGELADAISSERTVFKWVNFARDILNEPPNVIDPVSLSRLFQSEGRKAGLKITIWDEKRLERERCGGILAVGKGALHKPRLVIGEYKPRKARLHLALVGKGITFDTGGYCLKQAKSQIGMKYDMGGAAMAFGAACAAAELGLPIKIDLFTPLAENDISKTAYHVSDIIKMRSGKSVQVDNTDAEGRLILADALTLAGEGKPDRIIDAATLTGACVSALGEDIAGVFGTDEALVHEIIGIGRRVGEEFWPLPLYMPYMEQLKATMADCKNIGGKWGGAITAALFLKQFVDNDIKWVHLDIAGPAIKEEPLGHLGKGAKGFGIKTMVAWLRDI